MAKADLTAARLREVLYYSVVSGAFYWRIKCGPRAMAGARAGSKQKRGYVGIKLFGRLYKAHRLAWLYVLGEWPPAEIDHANGAPGCNGWHNLRSGGRSFNMQNVRHAPAHNRLGVLGVKAHSSGRFQASVKTDGKAKTIGTFDTPEEAHAAYIEAKRRLHPGCTI